jgi:hypothetical protein
LGDTAEEVLKRNITTTENNQRFLDWKGDSEFNLDLTESSMSPLIFSAIKLQKN